MQKRHEVNSGTHGELIWWLELLIEPKNEINELIEYEIHFKPHRLNKLMK